MIQANKIMVKYSLLIFFIISLAYVIPLYITATVQQKTWRLDSDYDSAWSAIDYSVDYFRTHGEFPIVHRYAGPNLPVRGDPTSPLYNPIALIPFLLFGFEQGMWLTIIISVSFAGWSMWVLLRFLKTTLPLALWGSILYMVSGPLAARIAAGHTNYVHTYPLWPLLFFFLFHPKVQRARIILFSVTISLIFLSGDIYGLFFFCLFYSIAQLYYVLFGHEKLTSIAKQTVLLILCSLFFSSIKLLFVVKDRQLLSQMIRLYTPILGQGSIHLPLTMLPFIIPWRVMFYDRPFFQRHLGFYFNWYEYYAFITPIPLFFLLFIRRVKNTILPLLLIILGAGLLFVAQKFPYSPFYWMFQLPFLSSFIRVPQRMYLPLTSIVIAVSVLCIRESKSRLLSGVLVCSLVWAFLTNMQTMSIGLGQKRTQEETFIQQLRNEDSGIYYVLNLFCCNQKILVQNHISIINFYAGWQSKQTPQFYDPTTGEFKKALLSTVRPKYILSPPTGQFEEYTYYPVIKTDMGTIWKTDQETIKPLP